MKVNLYIARFPYGASEHPDVTDWLVETVIKAKADKRIGDVNYKKGGYNDTPITMTRNLAVKDAQRAGADYLLMIDNDMRPDLPGVRAKPFWQSSLDFLLAQPGPSIVAAPYCGKPPHENVFIFRWLNWETGQPNIDLRLEQVSRDDACKMSGFEEVGALPTGLILIDMRVFERLSPPYFYYEWTDKTASEKASTEDVVFTRDASLAGIPIYVNWDAWAGHHKLKCVPRPNLLTIDQVRDTLVETIKRNHRSDERRVILKDGLPLGQRLETGPQTPLGQARTISQPLHDIGFAAECRIGPENHPEWALGKHPVPAAKAAYLAAQAAQAAQEALANQAAQMHANTQNGVGYCHQGEDAAKLLEEIERRRFQSIQVH